MLVLLSDLLTALVAWGANEVVDGATANNWRKRLFVVGHVGLLPGLTLFVGDVFHHLVA